MSQVFAVPPKHRVKWWDYSLLNLLSVKHGIARCVIHGHRLDDDEKTWRGHWPARVVVDAIRVERRLSK